ncbi:MAG: IS1634 family transposase, partial [bacterium]|nr:IS1634 family transposase [bacterium]
GEKQCSVIAGVSGTSYNDGMYLRRCRASNRRNGKVYWDLVESYRTERGPRQRVVAYLGDVSEAEGLCAKRTAKWQKGYWQSQLFDEDPEPEWVEVDTKGLRVEMVRDFGGFWLGLEIAEKLGLIGFLDKQLPQGREDVPWSLTALTLVLMRLCEPSSELRIAEELYERSALGDLVGIPAGKINGDRLYRALDKLLPQKAELEKHLKERLGQLFRLEYDLLLYDVTSTYFEGESEDNKLAKRGYSRDHRPDCKQICIALVVSREGLPLGYEVFAGNRTDVTTVEEIVKKIEKAYGKAGPSAEGWVMDRGMVSEKNLTFLKADERRYIVGTPKSQLRQFEKELLGGDWEEIREGLEVKKCASPDGKETFVLCRSAARQEKEKAMHERFEKRIEKGLEKLVESCAKKKRQRAVVERQIGRLLGANSRAARLFKVEVAAGEDGRVTVGWEKVEGWRYWANMSEGCYMLRSNIEDLSAEQLWQAYIQLTEAESAFRIHKSDLKLRPIWHQKTERVKGHILVCFLAYVLWKTLGQMCKRAGLGSEPRRVFDEIAQIKVVDVVMPTKQGVEIRKRCIAQPTKLQAILLQRLQLHLPERMRIQKV